MLNKVVNGYTIIAHEHTGDGYVVLGMRLLGPGSYEYVTARMANIDTDTEWFWGHYHTSLDAAVLDYNARKPAWSTL